MCHFVGIGSTTKGEIFMNLFAVSFFGHREVDDPFVIEQQLEVIIRELLLTKEYVEFLVAVGRKIRAYSENIVGVEHYAVEEHRRCFLVHDHFVEQVAVFVEFHRGA